MNKLEADCGINILAQLSNRGMGICQNDGSYEHVFYLFCGL